MFSVKSAAMVAAASVAALGLGACTAQPGTALSVNGVKYSEAQITEGVQDYAALTGTTLDRSTVVRMLPDALKFTELANDLGLKASDADVQSYLDQLVTAGKVKKPADGLGTVMTEILRYTVISSELNSLDQDQISAAGDEFKKISADQVVDVNPRYGTVTATGTTVLPMFGDVVDATTLAAQQSGATDSGQSGSSESGQSGN
ncbi:hypothetical protein [Actinomyces culturomici]|uniref:hypothetical protein n=1 Tax=Actinomyces culturomici TaxID=1926276 RepID=UPI001356CBB0|nr:hypothetical protein [Actinomyces culturomici]